VSAERTAEPVDEILLTLPALASYSRVARLAVAGIGSRLQFDYDDIEDLRIAVGEIYGLLGDDPACRITVRCLLDTESLTVEASREPAGAPLEVPDLTRRILEGVVDAVTIDADHGLISVRKDRQP